MATHLASESDYDTVLSVTARHRRLDTAIDELATASEFTPLVHRLGYPRGVATLAAFSPVPSTRRQALGWVITGLFAVGVAADRAAAIAQATLAGMEGALILRRADRDVQPLER